MKKHLLTLIAFCGFSATSFSQARFASNNSIKEGLSMMDDEVYDAGLADDFAKNKGKLPWPVDNGIIAIPFGKYQIGETKLKGNNPGITIATRSLEAPVKAVFDGIVSEVDSKGEVTTVFIRHGKYYTVYSNLSGINVSVGAIVKKGEIIGSIGESYEASGGELSFIIMSGTMNVNPISWLRR